MEIARDQGLILVEDLTRDFILEWTTQRKPVTFNYMKKS